MKHTNKENDSKDKTKQIQKRTEGKKNYHKRKKKGKK